MKEENLKRKIIMSMTNNFKIIKITQKEESVLLLSTIHAIIPASLKSMVIFIKVDLRHIKIFSK